MTPQLRFVLTGMLILPCLSLQSQTFTQVTQQAGIAVPAGLGDVAVWIDYDNDGWPDFFGGSSSQTFFYRNNTDGTFTDISASSGLSQTTPRAMAVCDYDKDGWDDLLLCSINASEPPVIYRNNSGNNFVAVSIVMGYASRAIWLDYNGDGLADIFANTGSMPLLMKNAGNNLFINTYNPGFNPQSGSTSSACDFDNDGFTDIYCTVSNTMNTNRLYRNIAGETFKDVTYASGTVDFRDGAAQAWGDPDNDGFFDLYIGNISSNRNVLFENEGNAHFTDITLAAGVPDAGDARSCAWVDYNNDGLLDLFTTNHVNPNRLYRNNGNGTFTDVAPAAGISGPQDGFGVSWADYDRDGDADVLIAGHSYSVALLRNDGGNNQHFLNLTLAGSYDNANGIGCRIIFYSNNHVQYREINGGRGAVSQDELSIHLGLGNDTMVDSIIIQWPSGMLQKAFNISANQFITIYQAGNVPPVPFHLIEPAETTICTGNPVLFRWKESHDPDLGNTVHYFLHIYNNTHDTAIGPLPDTFAVVMTPAWMADDSTFWYVAASDGTDIRKSWETWNLQIDLGTSDDALTAVNGRNMVIHHISPVPAKDYLIIDLEMRTETPLQISIISTSGKLLINRNIPHPTAGRNRITLPLSGISPGCYLLRISSERQTLTRKLPVMP
ncbi:MAG TPA: FG-GAP-like repeat-containing protein [Bacteroidales bacterium]|nr:FG-GAP-like repeat-containing protein [Bacteroidales bacterium]HSA42387.1 FG-GAP-like repeat-containing protein [Bacteroidales bacterium]